MKNINRDRILKRKKRISSNIKGTEKMPRVSVFRSNRYIYLQAINDEKRATLAAFSSLMIKGEAGKKITKTEAAKLIGEGLAKALIKKGIDRAIFDRGSYAYHGRVKALTEGIRKGGIKI